MLRVHFCPLGTIFALTLAPYCNVSLAATLSGTVIGVIDGDTIEVLHSNRAERIRLHGFDCPEKGQAFGKRAKQATSELALDRN